MYRTLLEFQAKLNTLQDWLPDGGIAEEETPYEITRLQIVSIPGDSLESRPNRPAIRFPGRWIPHGKLGVAPGRDRRPTGIVARVW